MTENKCHYHQLSIVKILQKFNVTANGLSPDEVIERRKIYGSNTMPQPKSKTWLQIFFNQFLNPLIYVLIGAAIISAVAGDLKDASFIIAVILLNAVLGTYQERQAENGAAALRKMVKVKTRVVRGGKTCQIDAEELVPGDITLLESGNKIPADLRVLHVQDLFVEEALLTGESMPVAKSNKTLKEGQEQTISDKVNMLFAATTVQKGRGKAVVVATGNDTELGKIAESLKVTEGEQPPLVQRMEVFSKRISIIVLAIVTILGIIGYYKGIPLNEVFLFMVAVGVSAIPEGLPVALTVTLSIGTRRMARRNVIVRKLPAVEGLGSCTIIASDKTGTLTLDQQSVKSIFLPSGKRLEVTGQGYNGEGKIKDGEIVVEKMDDELFRFLQAVVLSNEGTLRRSETGWDYSGDAVDVAFRALAYKAGQTPSFFHNGIEIIKTIPYESENGYSAVFFRDKGELFFAMKGAVEVVVSNVIKGQHSMMEKEAEKMTASGYRVLAIAGGKVFSTEALPPLHLLGLVGMIDPLRPEAKEAVLRSRQAGIEVVMITGDHPVTALVIAKKLGIAQTAEEVITGSELLPFQKVSDKELAKLVSGKKVFARVSPLQKQRIVEAQKYLGHFVAVTGDGANDAPALKSAHIGIAMGGGTDLAKEAADIIVTDNNFASIAAGVEEGRFTYDNIRKIIYFLIATGVAELLTIALVLLFDLPLPFLAVQLLWLNLVTNGIQHIALAFEKGDKNVMQKPPRKPGESIFDKLMNTQILVSGTVIALVVFALWTYLINYLQYDEVHARTVIMMLMVLLQNFHVLNCRSETKSTFRIPLKNNHFLIAGILLAQLVHVAASYIPGLNTTLQLDPIRFDEWIKLLPTALVIVLVMEVFKKIWNRMFMNAQGASTNDLN